jgi:mono/diheme cytochrome c family protein
MNRVLVMAAVALAIAAGPLYAQDAKVEKGLKVYTDQKCSMCHAIGGHGNAKGPLDGVGSKLTADEIRQWIIDAKGMTAKSKSTRTPAMSTMAAKYAALAKDDVDALVAYLQTLKKK